MRPPASLFAFAILLMLSLGIASHAQDQNSAGQPQNELVNGDVESVEDQRPTGWRINPADGLIAQSVTDDVQEGEQAVVLNTEEVDFEASGIQFLGLSQIVDATELQGKRVRFRAAVRTEGKSDDARAQLWMRVDRTNGEMGSFDNMQDRPIVNSQWKHYEVVLDVGTDAKQIILGMLVFGQGKVWFDDASLTVVDDDVESTNMVGGGTPNSSADESSDDESESSDEKEKKPAANSNRFPEVLMKAFQDAENAPQQPFFNHWLWIVALCMGLFTVAFWPQPKPEPLQPSDSTKPGRRPWVEMLPRFAFFFSFSYWVLYNFPFPFSGLIPKYGPQFNAWLTKIKATIVEWTAQNLFNLQNELVPPNGSGDTTYSYILIFVVFCLAMIVAILWTVLDWLLANRDRFKLHWLRDLLRSYLRYVLAFWMLSYGLAKVALVYNQFSAVGEWQFQKPWGDSSPMNVVWSFMGTSQAYTIFAGAGEVAGALLLIWRRTTILGAMVTLGVMINVMMLNYCYDVPVKLFSTHLVVMAICVLLPDLHRLANVLFWNRVAEPVDFRPPYTGSITIWLQRLLKGAIIVFGFVIPIYNHVGVQWNYLQEQAKLPDYFGQYEIEDYQLAGESVPQNKDNSGWQSAKFTTRGTFSAEGKREVRKRIHIVRHGTPGMIAISFRNDDDPNLLQLDEHNYPDIPAKLLSVEVIDEDHLILSGETTKGLLKITLKRNETMYRLTGRGYRWINEVPFNR